MLVQGRFLKINCISIYSNKHFNENLMNSLNKTIYNKIKYLGALLIKYEQDFYKNTKEKYTKKN